MRRAILIVSTTFDVDAETVAKFLNFSRWRP